jgi:hypothetical protein
MSTAPITHLPTAEDFARRLTYTEAEYYLRRLIAMYPRAEGQSDAAYFAYLLTKLPSSQ